jgi:hypothetical protein
LPEELEPEPPAPGVAVCVLEVWLVVVWVVVLVPVTDELGAAAAPAIPATAPVTPSAAATSAAFIFIEPLMRCDTSCFEGFCLHLR